MTSDCTRLGDATLTRVIETQVDNLPVEVFPCTPREVWREGEAWVPTFPNARHLVSEPDYRHFCPGGAAQTSTPLAEGEESVQQHVRTVFADSVSPVQEQIELWSGDHRLSESL